MRDVSHDDLAGAVRQLEETAAQLEERLRAQKAKTLGPLDARLERLRREEARLQQQNARLLAQCEALEREAGSPRRGLALRALTWSVLGGGYLQLAITGLPVSGDIGFGLLVAALMVAFAVPRLR